MVDLNFTFAFDQASPNFQHLIEMLAERTNWTSPVDQQIWFDKFKCRIDDNQQGINFCQFQELLNATIYKLLSRCLPSSKSKINNNNENDLDGTEELDLDELNRFTHEQELEIFKVFDTKTDHMIDQDEFAFLCKNWLDKIYHPTNALIVVDVQNDFIDGSLALLNAPAGQDGIEVVPVINQLLELIEFDAVVYTQDWHPIDHIAFHDNLHLRKYQLKTINRASDDSRAEVDSTGNRLSRRLVTNDENNDTSNGNITFDDRYKLDKLIPKAQVFDIVLFDDGKVEQKLWPRHCIQDSWGAELNSKLKVIPGAIRILKGTLSNLDAYSAFWDNSRLNETGLRQELTTRGISDLFFCGLALDYCVSASALDSVKSGFATIVIEDACRGIDLNEIKKVKKELRDNGALLTTSQIVQDYFIFQDHIRKSSEDTKRVDIEQLLIRWKTSNELGHFLKEIYYRKAMNSVKGAVLNGNSSGKLQ